MERHSVVESRDPRFEKEKWAKGPWQDEPDRIEWRYGQFACLMRRVPMGVWCGYVAIPPGHPWHGLDYDSPDVSVHGGLTYAAGCTDDVCHVPLPGESDDVWWLGFDCGHGFDRMPVLDHMMRRHRQPEPSPEEDPYADAWPGGSTYRDVAYVMAEVESLAEQAASAARDEPHAL